MAEAQRQISELEEQLRAQPTTNQQQAASITQEELRNLKTALAKTQKAAEMAETEVGRLRDELLGNRSLRMEARENRKTEDPVPIRLTDWYGHICK